MANVGEKRHLVAFMVVFIFGIGLSRRQGMKEERVGYYVVMATTLGNT